MSDGVALFMIRKKKPTGRKGIGNPGTTQSPITTLLVTPPRPAGSAMDCQPGWNSSIGGLSYMDRDFRATVLKPRLANRTGAFHSSVCTLIPSSHTRTKILYAAEKVQLGSKNLE